MAITHWSPFRKIIKINAGVQFLYIRHSNGELYKYSLDSPDYWLIATLPVNTRGFVITNDHVYYMTMDDRKVYRINLNTQLVEHVFTSSFDDSFHIFSEPNHDAEFFYIAGTNVDFNVLNYEKVSIQTGLLDSTITPGEEWWGSYTQPVANNSKIFQMFDGNVPPEFIMMRLVDIASASTEMYLPNVSYQGDVISGFGDILSYYDFVGNDKFYIINAVGNIIGIFTPPLNDYIPGSDYFNYQLSAMAISESKMVLITVCRDSQTFISVYDYSINPEKTIATLGNLVYTKTCPVSNEITFFTWLTAQIFDENPAVL